MEKTFNYKPQGGVCATDMTFKVNGNILTSYECVGGCPGNYLGMKKLLEGMRLSEIIARLKDVKCRGKETSCPQEIAKALIQYKKENLPEKMPEKIKLYNRYGEQVYLVRENDSCEYKLTFEKKDTEESGFYRMGFNPDSSVNFIDPTGGPFIKVGTNIGTIREYTYDGIPPADTKERSDMDMLEVMSIEFKSGDGVYFTLN